MEKFKSVPFVQNLERLRDAENRGALAALRRGLGKPPGVVAAMHPYVAPWLPAGVSPRQEEAYYLVGALFAAHPDSGGVGSMGSAMARIRLDTGSDSVEQRFIALLSCHVDELPQHLRHAVSLAKSKGVPIDWHQLLRDIRGWNNSDRYVQRHWARDFWSNSPTAEDEVFQTVDAQLDEGLNP